MNSTPAASKARRIAKSLAAIFDVSLSHILIRPISARYMHDKEVKSYEKENPNL